jgi:glycerate kinase
VVPLLGGHCWKDADRETDVLTPDRLLLASGPFGPGLSAARVTSAIARGVRAGGLPEPDLCPIPPCETEDGIGELLDELDFDARMRRARAVIIGDRRLEERTLSGSMTFEIATRARQGGVPAYAVTAENALGVFDARILDLQVILQAGSTRALAAAGRKLAGLV